MSGENRVAIGSFTEIENDKVQREIIVSQSITSYYSGREHIAPKQYHIGNINGPEVFRTEDQNVFLLADGTPLKKRGYISG